MTSKTTLLLVLTLMTPLLPAAEIHDTVESGETTKVAALFKQDPKLVHAKNADGDQPLHLAARRDDVAMIELLLEAGADVNAKGAKGWTPLHYAGAIDSKDACLALLEKGANRDARNDASQKPEQTARIFTRGVIKEYNPQMAGADKLFTAIEGGDAERVKALIAGNPKLLRAQDGQGRTTLVLAAETNKPELLKLLIEAGAEVNTKGRHTALSKAAEGGHLEVVRLLLKHGAEVNPSRPDGPMDSMPLRAAAFTVDAGPAGAAFSAELDDIKMGPDGSPDPTALRKKVAKLKADSPEALEGTSSEIMAKLVKPQPEPVREAKRAILKLLLEAGADPKKDDQAIIAAATSSETEMVRLLLARGANPNAEHKGMSTALGYAVAIGAPFPLIQMLLTAGADPLRVTNPKLTLGASALSIAVGSKNKEVIDVILAALKPADLSAVQHFEVFRSLMPGDPAYLRRALDAGFKINAKQTDGRTALMAAARVGSARSVRLLLAAGADVSARDKNSLTALNLAATTDSTETTRALLEAGADVNAQDEAGFTPLATAVERRRKAQVSALLAHGAKLEPAIKTGQTPLLLAASYGYADIVELLLKAGAKATVVWSKDGSNALHSAAASGRSIKEEPGFKKGEPGDYAATVKLLLDAGLPVDRPEPREGFTALQAAASSGNVEVARLLLAKGAEVNTPSQDGRTPLHFAAGGSSIELIALLLDHKANIDAVQSGHPGKATPMMYALQNGRVENLKLLLKRGANLKATFHGVGATALHVAAQMGQVEMSKVLLDAGIKIDARDQYQMTPLISAVTAGQREIAELLIERGSDVNASMVRNNTALKTAMGKGDSAMILLLKAHGAKE